MSNKNDLIVSRICFSVLIDKIESDISWVSNWYHSQSLETFPKGIFQKLVATRIRKTIEKIEKKIIKTLNGLR